jgi:hypothetical protein
LRLPPLLRPKHEGPGSFPNPGLHVTSGGGIEPAPPPMKSALT